MYWPCCPQHCCQGKARESLRNRENLLYEAFCHLVHDFVSVPCRIHSASSLSGCALLRAGELGLEVDVVEDGERAEVGVVRQPLLRRRVGVLEVLKVHLGRRGKWKHVFIKLQL